MGEITAEQLANYRVDKTGWPDGPWMTEPDRTQWQHAGFACMTVRHPRHGYWCSYVGVDRAHPCYGKHPLHDGKELFAGIEADLNYGDHCDGVICHVPDPGMPDDVWWLGMDFGHALDYAPGMAAREAEMETRLPAMREIGERVRRLEHEVPSLRPLYRDLAYVKAETESLAEQLRKIAEGGGKP